MPTELVVLGEQQKTRLSYLEGKIEVGLQCFFRDVGGSLLLVRDEQLYIGEHQNFDDYCMQRWHITSTRAKQLIDSSKEASRIDKVNESLPEHEQVPQIENERQGREALRVPEEQRDDVLREARGGNGRTSSSKLRTAVTKAVQKSAPKGMSKETCFTHLREASKLMQKLGIYDEFVAELSAMMKRVREL